jgi:pimeloyl-ACP methyl ester carboxylesterase
MALSPQGTAYELTGQVGAPVVVLIHGLGLTRASTWGTIAPVLATKFQVLTFDLLGHGQTALPQRDVSLSSLAAQLVGLLDDLGINRAALVGFSLGGMINRRLAMDHPERVSALVVLNSPHERTAEAQKLVEARAKDTGVGGPAANLDETLARWFTHAYHRDHQSAVAAVRQVVLANDPGNYAAHRQVLASGVIELIRPAPPITQPTLVMACENDTGSTPAMAHAIASEIVGARTIIVPKLQHLGLIERPRLFTEPVQNFLMRALTIGQTT